MSLLVRVEKLTTGSSWRDDNVVFEDVENKYYLKSPIHTYSCIERRTVDNGIPDGPHPAVRVRHHQRVLLEGLRDCFLEFHQSSGRFAQPLFLGKLLRHA